MHWSYIFLALTHRYGDTFMLCVPSFNSLALDDAIGHHKTWSTLAQIIAWQLQAITWASVNLSVRSCGIDLKAVLQAKLASSITKQGLKIRQFKLQLHLWVANELTQSQSQSHLHMMSWILVIILELNGLNVTKPLPELIMTWLPARFQ